MGLLSFLQRRVSASPAVPVGGEDDIAAARTRARRRLMGAAVLVLLGVIGFPLVFETQPRPIPVDIPIEIPRKEGAPALAMPAPRRPVAAASAPVVAPREPVITETAAEAGKEVAAAKPVASAPAVPAASAAVEAPRKVAAPAAKPASAGNEASRAKALLEGKEAKPEAAALVAKGEAPAEAGRFVVQVGAFADAAAAREVRGKVDKLGLKTYTQVVETSSGSRIRVRAGPFGSRDEADKALAKAKAAGLNAVVLTL